MQVKKRDDFSLRNVINSLNKNQEFVTLGSLKWFFNRNGFYATTKDLQAILKRLDLNYDDAVTEDELAKFLLVNNAQIEYPVE